MFLEILQVRSGIVPEKMSLRKLFTMLQQEFTGPCLLQTVVLYVNIYLDQGALKALLVDKLLYVITYNGYSV